MNGPYYGALFAAIVLGVCGQLLFKSGALRSTELLGQFLDPRTVGGFVVYACSAVLYVISLRRLPVSVAFPSVSLSYVAVALAGRWLWHEPLGTLRLAGIVCIFCGVTLLNYAH